MATTKRNIGNAPRAPRASTEVRRAADLESGAPIEITKNPTLTTDDRRRLTVKVQSTSLVLASRVFGRR